MSWTVTSQTSYVQTGYSGDVTEFRLGLGSLALDLVATVADRPGSHRERLHTPDDLDRWLVETELVADTERLVGGARRRAGTAGGGVVAGRTVAGRRHPASGGPPARQRVGRPAPPGAPAGDRLVARPGQPQRRRQRAFGGGARRGRPARRAGPEPGSGVAVGAPCTSWTGPGRATAAGAPWSCAATAARPRRSGTVRSARPCLTGLLVDAGVASSAALASAPASHRRLEGVFSQPSATPCHRVTLGGVRRHALVSSDTA